MNKSLMNKSINHRLSFIWLALLTLPLNSIAAPQLKDFSAELVGSNTVTVYLSLSESVESPRSFTVDKPNRLILDFKGTGSTLPNGNRIVGIGLLQSVDTLSTGSRTRVVFNLTRAINHQIAVDGKRVVVALSAAEPPTAPLSKPHTTVPATTSAAQKTKFTQPTAADISNLPTTQAPISGVTDIGFQRGKSGEGRVLITVSDPAYKIDIVKENGKLKITLLGAGLPESLERRLDVTDFDTPIQFIDSFGVGDGTELIIDAPGNFTHFSYQNANQYVIELRASSSIEAREAEEDVVFSGEKLSLNFQDIEVRTVLDIIAEFTETNIIVSDQVQGRVTLRLKDVPWDQALDLILQSQGLALRRSGNIIRIAPASELATQERLELESQSQLTELSPVRSEVIAIKYATATQLATLLTETGEGGDDTGDAAAGAPSLISSRGRVIADDRTNTLIIYETADRLQQIKDLIDRLDQPVKQVLIQARIVAVADSYSRDLGSRFGFGASGGNSPLSGTIGGTGADGFQTTRAGGFTSSPPPTQVGNTATTTVAPSAQLLISDFGLSDAAAKIGFLIGRNNHQLLQLELHALEIDGLSKTIATPRVITADQQQATIQDGTLVATPSESASGGIANTFTPATLSLTVTPRITPDQNVVLDLVVSNDAPGVGANITTQQVSTRVIVHDGDTVVLGGVYRESKSESVNKIPFLGDLPLVGQAFRRKQNTNNKSELLIFVTPKILPTPSDVKQ